MKKIIKQSRAFGILLSILFALLSLYLYFNKTNYFYIFFIFTLFFFGLAVLYPLSLRILNFLWRRLGIYLGMIISPIILSIIYFFLFTLTKIFLIFFRKDLLDLKKNNNQNSYWKVRSSPLNNMTDQF